MVHQQQPEDRRSKMVIATTASIENICRVLGKSADRLYEDMSLTDSNRAFIEAGETFHVFALLPSIDGQKEIIKPLEEKGFKAKQL
jgi:hypothetical protein